MSRYIAIINLEERLSSTGFSSEVVDGQALSIYSYYTCTCGQKIRFDEGNLKKAEKNPKSCIEESEQSAIEATASEFLDRNDSFLDFFCPACRKPVRLYFQPWAGGRHGDSGIEWRFIVERV